MADFSSPDAVASEFSRNALIRAAIERAGRYLPSQGPIGVFIAQNMLHAFEGERFEDAVVRAARLFGTQPYLSESRYREALAHGRIRAADLEAVLDGDLAGLADEPLCGGRLSLRDLHLALLLHPVRQESDTAVRWTLTESDVLERLRDDLSPEMRWRLLSHVEGASAEGSDSGFADLEDESARRATMFLSGTLGQPDEERRAASELWHACVEAVALTRPSLTHVQPPLRHRDLILAVAPGLDTDALVHPLLIRWCAAFLDQGVAAWPMPGRERGLLEAVARMYSSRFGPTEPWNASLPGALRRLRGMPGLEVIACQLDLLGVPESAWGEYLTQTVLALRGWAGMISHLEQRPDRAPVEPVPARLVDFVALRLVCDRVAAEWAARQLGFEPMAANGGGRLSRLWVELRDRYPPKRGPGSLSRAFMLHQVSQLVGLSSRDIRGLDENELLRFERAIAAFDGFSRRRLFHLAYERRHRIETLDALASHVRFGERPAARPSFQAILCMDERCESFRRHFEELGPRFETFGTAGFFAVPMYYRGIDDWHASPLCPIVTRPRHTVVEVPEHDALARYHFRRNLRRRVGQLTGGAAVGSRTLFRGGLFTALAGAVAAVPLVARVVFPRLTARLGRTAGDLARGRVPTRLVLERDEAAGLLPDGTYPGFDVPEMAAIVRRVLEDIGLTSGFSRLVAVIGHGSSSRNNPHESAYDCGACGGSPGGANARAFAMMANDARVRAQLAMGGLSIPADVVFIGGMLDTCADTVAWFDVGLLPEGHRADIDMLRRACEHACLADAHERCRRFESAPLDITPREAGQHVEGRSVDLAQVRPELGHATNATAVIGRRLRTRGLFLDRRAFLVSYDPTSDQDGEILARTLAAVGPVAAGISLAYFFSAVDRLGYGCDTKLPHNITGLIGVMDGHSSDLRTGLPWQAVEIHEPLRLLVVVEADEGRIMAALDRLPDVGRLVRNRWVQLVACDPAGGSLSVFEDGAFVPYLPERNDIPVVDRSVSWYSGRRDHLAPARVLAALVRRPAPLRTGSA